MSAGFKHTSSFQTFQPSDVFRAGGAAYALKFRTRTHLIQPSGKSREAVPPPALFFYERVHTRAHESLDETLDWPWGFWSTKPHDEMEPLERDDADGIRARKQRIRFQGVSRDGEFMWAQRVGRCAKFSIKVRWVSRFSRDAFARPVIRSADADGFA